MHTTFTPRPIYRVKPYAYLAEAGDTAQSIAKKFGRPEGDYRELVAANLEGRKLMPMHLGSPFGSRTFAAVKEGEELKIPSHWPDPVSALGDPSGTTSVQAPDSIVQGISSTLTSLNTASGSPVPANLVPSVTNAATQWWMNSEGTTPAASPTDYVPYVTSAVSWLNAYGSTVAQQGGPAAPANFPWGAFLAMLPTQVTMPETDWTGTIPGTNNTPWSSIPWSYIAQVGPQLEQITPGQVDWSNSTPQGMLTAFQNAIGPALAQLNGGTTTVMGCSSNATMNASNGQCYCNPGYAWATPTFDPNNPLSYQCVPQSTQAPPATTPPAGSTPTTTTTPPTPPSGRNPTSNTNAITATPAATSVSPYLIGAGILAATAVVAGAVVLGMKHAHPEGRAENPVDSVSKHVRVYDQPESFDRYTIVFTGNYRHRTGRKGDKKKGPFIYLGASAHPFSPQGFGTVGESDRLLDRPSHSHLGKKISFEELPADVQKFAIQTWRDIWGIKTREENPVIARKRLGLLLNNWHDSINDPIYAVGSFYLSNIRYPEKEIVEKALAGIKRDRDEYGRMLRNEPVVVERGGRKVLLKEFAGFTDRDLKKGFDELGTIERGLQHYLKADY